MKKFILSSLTLIVLACSITLFQMSCHKDAIAETEDNVIQQNKIVYTKRVQENPREIWIANYDGSNQNRININLPSGYDISNDVVKISPDYKTLFFIAYKGCDYSLFKCNLDGSNLLKIIDGASLGCESIKGFDVF